jgi:hypothetical protein
MRRKIRTRHLRIAQRVNAARELHVRRYGYPHSLRAL